MTPFVTEKMEPTKKGREGTMTGQKFINLVRDENLEEFDRLVDDLKREVQGVTTQEVVKAQSGNDPYSDAVRQELVGIR